jgi:DNA-binding beta-propeller fold protein YncE
VTPGSGGLSFAGGIDIGPSGDIFVVNVGVLNDTSVIRYDGGTGEPLGTFAAGADAVGFLTLRFGPGGALYVSNNASNTIDEYDGRSGEFIRTFVAAGSGGLNNPVGLTFGPLGNLFVVSKRTDSILETDRILEYDGTTGTFVGTTADLTLSGFSAPVDIEFAADGSLYVTISGDESVARVDAEAGTAEAFVGPGSGGLDSPGGLRFHPDTGNLLVVSQGSNSVLEYDGDTGEFLRVFATGSDNDNLFFMVFRPR